MTPKGCFGVIWGKICFLSIAHFFQPAQALLMVPLFLHPTLALAQSSHLGAACGVNSRAHVHINLPEASVSVSRGRGAGGREAALQCFQ
jgi:hypothetical protein